MKNNITNILALPFRSLFFSLLVAFVVTIIMVSLDGISKEINEKPTEMTKEVFCQSVEPVPSEKDANGNVKYVCKYLR